MIGARRVLVAVLAVIPWVGGAQSRPVSSIDQQLTGALDLYFSRAEAIGFSGAVLIARHDSIVLRKGYGFADRRTGRRATPSTIFAIASLDKQFLAAAILKLQELGKVRTSDRLDRFFDFVPADKREITLQHLLTHTSGLPNAYWDEHPGSRLDFVRYVLSRPSVGAPGAVFRYSNANFWILEEIIARASNQPFEQFLRQSLFVPAGMFATGSPPVITDTAHVARYRYWSADPTSREPFDSTSVLGRPPWWWMILSTVDDLFQWHRTLRTARVLSDSSRSTLVTPFRQGYAMGWFTDRSERGTRVIRHSGSDSNLGGFLADYREYPDEGVSVFILSNSMLGQGLTAASLGADVEHILFGGLATLPPAVRRNPAPSHNAAAGKYTLPGGGTFELVALKSGDLILRGADRRGRLGLRFPGLLTDSTRLPRDDVAREALRAASRGEYDALRQLSDSTDYEQMRALVKDVTAPTPQSGPLRDVRAVHERVLVVEGELRRQTFICLDFAAGCQMLRVAHRPSGRAIIDYVSVPRFTESRLAATTDGALLAWDMTLSAGLKIEPIVVPGAPPAQLRLTSAYGTVLATRVSP